MRGRKRTSPTWASSEYILIKKESPNKGTETAAGFLRPGSCCLYKKRIPE